MLRVWAWASVAQTRAIEVIITFVVHQAGQQKSPRTRTFARVRWRRTERLGLRGRSRGSASLLASEADDGDDDADDQIEPVRRAVRSEEADREKAEQAEDDIDDADRLQHRDRRRLGSQDDEDDAEDQVDNRGQGVAGDEAEAWAEEAPDTGDRKDDTKDP